MIVNTLYYRLSEDSAHHLRLIMAAAPMEVFPEKMILPIIFTSNDIAIDDTTPPLVSGTPVALRTPYSAITASTQLICELKSQQLNLYIHALLLDFDGARSMYTDQVNYPYMIVRNAPTMGRRQRGWMANMSTTLAQSSPTLVFDRPTIERSSV